jgi:hypothetical protein
MDRRHGVSVETPHVSSWPMFVSSVLGRGVSGRSSPPFPEWATG